MDYVDVSDYDYVCCDCAKVIHATGFFCGMPQGLPDECPDCKGTDVLPLWVALQNAKLNELDAIREDEQLRRFPPSS